MSAELALKNHLIDNPRKVHGIMDIVRTLIAAESTSLKGALVYDNVANAYLTDPLIQFGVAASSPVTFDVAFKAATTPMVVGLADFSSGMEIVTVHSRSNTGFSFTNKYYDGSGGAGNCIWIAIGERA